MPTIDGPNAGTISVAETLTLLDNPFREMADGVAEDRYGFWLGSGISFSRMPKLTLMAKKLLDFLQRRSDANDESCPFRKSLEAILDLAQLSATERSQIDLARPISEWRDIDTIADRLVLHYARMLELPPDGKAPDFLLWEAIDVVGTYADATKRPDAEHLCIAALIMEGVASDIASANWDGLIERSVNELSGGAPVLRVCVRPEDTRATELRANLYKFHGCAVLARENPAVYRERLVGRQSQINGWARRSENAVIAAKLIDMVTSKPTLMIGLSAQDSNIQGIFVEAEQRMQWPWPSHPPAYVFSEDELGIDQRGLLQNVYRSAFSAGTSQAIYDSAILRAYAKPLLTALWLYVIGAKLCSLIAHAPGGLAPGDCDPLKRGILALRDLAASACPHNGHETFVRSAFGRTRRSMTLFREGNEPILQTPGYCPISTMPAQHYAGEPSLRTSGLTELSVALGLVGISVDAGEWAIGVSNTATPEGGSFSDPVCCWNGRDILCSE